MILSMTGYGKAEGAIGNRKFTVELRSLNSKQLDMNVRMPSVYKEKEMKLRSFLTKEVVRGKSDLTIFYEAGQEEKKVTLNGPLMHSYYRDLKSIAADMDQEDIDYVGAIMKIPEVLRPHKEELDETEWGQIMDLVKSALEGFKAYRTQEGAVLFEDFKKRIDTILKLQSGLKDPLDDRMTRVKERIQSNLTEWVDAEKVDNNRFEQELIFSK